MGQAISGQELDSRIMKTPAGLALDLTITLPHGLHSRPSARAAQAARKYDADIWLIGEEGEVDAKSMLEILSLALKCNDKIRILARGPQAADAIRELYRLLTVAGE